MGPWHSSVQSWPQEQKMRLEPRPRPPWHGWSHYRSYFKCPQRFVFEQMYTLANPLNDMDRGRRIGSMCHGGVGQWLLDPQESWHDAVRRFGGLESVGDEEEQARRIIEEYVDHWSQRIRPEVLAVEYENSPLHLPIGGYYDAVVRDNGRAYIMEHKFQAQGLSDQFKNLSRDGQLLTYVILWGDREREKFGDLGGFILDLTDTRGALKFGRFTVAIEEIAESLNWWNLNLRRGIVEADEIERYLKVAVGPVTVDRRPVCTSERFACPYEKLCFQGTGMLGAYKVKS